jgi:hypothetical protein
MCLGEGALFIVALLRCAGITMGMFGAVTFFFWCFVEDESSSE